MVMMVVMMVMMMVVVMMLVIDDGDEGDDGGGDDDDGDEGDVGDDGGGGIIIINVTTLFHLLPPAHMKGCSLKNKNPQIHLYYTQNNSCRTSSQDKVKEPLKSTYQSAELATKSKKTQR